MISSSLGPVAQPIDAILEVSMSGMGNPEIENPSGDHFDATYSDWKGWRPANFGSLPVNERGIYNRELKLIERRRVRPIGSVLEVGFGNGGFLAYCRERGWTAVGSEISEPLVDAGRANGFDVLHADELADAPRGGFDLIAIFDVLEHVPQAQIIGLLSMLKGKLADDGVMLVRYPNADCWLGNQNFYGDPTHITQIGHIKLRYFCERAGLALRDFRPEARLGFDGGLAKGVHALVARPLIWLLSLAIRSVYFPRSKMVLSTANVIGHIGHADDDRLASPI
jgi:SAM-dependent methyltransferase